VPVKLIPMEPVKVEFGIEYYVEGTGENPIGEVAKEEGFSSWGAD